jgi:hypothetical protein
MCSLGIGLGVDEDPVRWQPVTRVAGGAHFRVGLVGQRAIAVEV